MLESSGVKLTLSKFRRRVFKNAGLIRRSAVILASILAIVLAGRFLLPAGKLAGEFLFGPVNVLSIILNRGPELKNDNGRTNILLLGIGGSGHEGPNLTDAMMVLSIKTTLSDAQQRNPPPVVLISIPRDIYIDSIQDKINFAYQEGLDKRVGTVLVKSIVSDVTGLPIHYAVVADFSAFEKVIDILGGIDVNVEHVLNDPGYPIAGREIDTCGFSAEEAAARAKTINISPASEIDAFPCRYETLHFDVGLHHMDGATALKFVRSRHAEGEEGTDFARNHRQQLVLRAIREKSLSTSTILNPQKIWDIYNQLKSHINSDIDSTELSVFFNLILKYRNAQIKTSAIDLNLLENPPVDPIKGWFLLPKGGNWDQVHQFVRSQLESK